jgi:hypothetical protein
VTPLSKTISIVLALASAGGPAQSRSLHITGTAGYLSEWELEGEIADAGPRGGGERVGRLVWKHVGLCSVNGPQERPGDIRIKLSARPRLMRRSPSTATAVPIAAQLPAAGAWIVVTRAKFRFRFRSSRRPRLSTMRNKTAPPKYSKLWRDTPQPYDSCGAYTT